VELSPYDLNRGRITFRHRWYESTPFSQSHVRQLPDHQAARAHHGHLLVQPSSQAKAGL